MANINKVNGNPIVVDTSGVGDKSITVAKLAGEARAWQKDDEYLTGFVGWQSGFFKPLGNLDTSGSGRYYMVVPCTPGDEIEFRCETDHSNIAAVAFFNDKVGLIAHQGGSTVDAAVRTLVNVGSTSVAHTATVPSYVTHMAITTNTSKVPLEDAYVKVNGKPYLMSRLDSAPAKVSSVVDAVASSRSTYRDCMEMVGGTVHDSTGYEIVNDTPNTGVNTLSTMGFYPNDTIVHFDDSKYKVVCVGYDENHAKINWAGWATSSPADFTELWPVVAQWDSVRFEIRRKDNATSIMYENPQLWVERPISVSGGSAKTAYVSTAGDDANDGSKDSPFATVSRALEVGASRVLVRGGRYFEQISLAGGADISITSYDEAERPEFLAPDCILATSSSSVSGYLNVQKATVSGFAPNSYNIWIFLDGVHDQKTLISDAERLPMQRGQEHRCCDTVIKRCTSTALSDALAEIEGAGEYKWYLDDDALYFSSPQAPSASHPLMKCEGTALFAGGGRNVSLHVSGIVCKYHSFNVNKMAKADITDCMVANVFGAGAFTYDQCLDAHFTRCEAARCFYGSTKGDGFNGHSVKTGDPLAKQTLCTLDDCWAHDNCDDGYSDHERSETVIQGGLFEHNGKAGVTPSYGSHCSCYGVVSRHNMNGFYYTGETAQDEGGKYGQMLCVGCLAEENTVGNGQRAGFRVDGTGNSALLIGCKSVGNNVGYRTDSNSQIKLIDCGSIDSTAKIGNVTAKNTTLVP